MQSFVKKKKMKTYLCILATALLLAAAVNAETVTPCSSSSASGDPHFTGFRGQRFEFQGSHGNVYNLVSSPSVQVNARFLGNSQWGDSRTFLDAISIQAKENRFSVACVNSTLVAEANGRTLTSSTPLVEDDMTVYVESSSEAFVGTPLMEFTVVKAKNRWASCFLNVDISFFENVDNIENVHGLIGQTARPESVATSSSSLTKYEDGVFAIEGSDDDYKIAEGHLFGNTFRFNKFSSAAAEATGRKLLGVSRALLADCSVCSQNPCNGHPDGMINCGVNPSTSNPECYLNDPSDFCAPSGCGGGPSPCDGLTPAPAGTCGSFTDQASCDSGYSLFNGDPDTLCMWDTGICIGSSTMCNPTVGPSGGGPSTSSSSSSPANTGCGTREASLDGDCTAFIAEEFCNNGYGEASFTGPTGTSTSHLLCQWNGVSCENSWTQCVIENGRVTDTDGNDVTCASQGPCENVGTGLGGEQAFCAPEGPGYVCICPPGYVFNVDNNACLASTGPQLWSDNDFFKDGTADITLDNGGHIQMQDNSFIGMGDYDTTASIITNDATCANDIRITDCSAIHTVGAALTCSAFYDNSGVCESNGGTGCQSCTAGPGCECIPSP